MADGVFGDATGYYDALIKQVENQYELGKAEISSRLSAAKIGANASVKSAQIGANATIKAAKIRADVDRYGIDVNAAVEREKIGLAREEMNKIGIPGVLIDAWTAEKNYEVAKQTIGVNIAQTVAELRSTPDKYFMAADFEAVLPYMLNSAQGQAGGGMNGAVGTNGTPNPNSLEGVVSALMGTGAATGTSGPLSNGTSGSLFEQIKAMTQGSGTSGTGTGGTGATSGGSPDQVKSAIMSTGMQAIGGLPLNGTIQSGDVTGWFQNLASPWHAGDVIPGTSTAREGLLPTGEYDPLSPSIKAVADAARAAGYDMSFYDSWVQRVHPPAAAAPAPVAAAPTTPAPTGQLNERDATMLAGISAMMEGKNYVDPFLLDKMDPTQAGLLAGGLKRLGYDPNTVFANAQRQRPGQGDPLAA